MFNTRRSTLDPQQKHRRNKQTQHFSYLDRCLQIPCDDKLIIRNLIKNQNQMVVTCMSKYKRDKNLSNLQVNLRKIVKNYKSQQGSRLWMRPDRMLQSGNKQRLDRSKQSKQMFKSINAFPRSNSKQKGYGQYRKTPQSKNSPKKKLVHNQKFRSFFPTTTSSQLSNQTRNSMSQRFIFQNYNNTQSQQNNTQEQENYKVDEGLQRQIQCQIDKQIQNQYNNMSNITLNAKDITVRQDEKSSIFDEQSFIKQKYPSKDFNKTKEKLQLDQDLYNNVWPIKSIKPQVISITPSINQQSINSNSILSLFPSPLQPDQININKYQQNSYSYHENSIQTQYHIDEASRIQAIISKKYPKNEKGIGVAAMVKDFFKKPNLCVESENISQEENCNQIIFKTKNKENIFEPPKNYKNFYNKLMNCMNSQQQENKQEVPQNSINQDTIPKYVSNENSPSVNNFLSLSEKNRFVVQDDHTQRQQTQSFRHQCQFPVNQISINVQKKFQHIPSKRRESKDHRIVIDEKQINRQYRNGNSMYGYSCWGKDSEYQRSQSDSGPYKQACNYTENKNVGNKNTLINSYSHLPISKSKLQITKKLGFDKLDSDCFRTDYMTVSRGSYVMSQHHQTDQDNTSNHNYYNDILGNHQNKGTKIFKKTQLEESHCIKKYPFGQFYKRIQQTVDGDIL